MTILIVEDHPIYAEGLKNLLESRGFEDVAIARGGLEAVALAKRLEPSIVLMDIAMPDMDGIQATELIKADCPECKVIMLTSLGDEESLFRAITAGASGYLLKTVDGDELARCLTELREGKNPFTSGLAENLLSEFRRRGPSIQRGLALTAGLSARQKEILTFLADGLTYKEMGARLFISERTVKFHIEQIKKVLCISSRNELIAFSRGIVGENPHLLR